MSGLLFAVGCLGFIVGCLWMIVGSRSKPDRDYPS
jgi:hypothetical protein